MHNILLFILPLRRAGPRPFSHFPLSSPQPCSSAHPPTEHSRGLLTTPSPVATCLSAGWARRAPHDTLNCRDIAAARTLPATVTGPARARPASLRAPRAHRAPGPVPLLPRPRRCRSAGPASLPPSAAAAPQHPPGGRHLPAAARRPRHRHPELSPGLTLRVSEVLHNSP